MNMCIYANYNTCSNTCSNTVRTITYDDICFLLSEPTVFVKEDIHLAFVDLLHGKCSAMYIDKYYDVKLKDISNYIQSIIDIKTVTSNLINILCVTLNNTYMYDKTYIIKRICILSCKNINSINILKQLKTYIDMN